MKALLSLLLGISTLQAAELTLLHDKKSEYQIVIPEQLETPALEASIQQTARLLQAAFQSNGAEVPVVSEKHRDTSKPALFLGSTAFALAHGVDPRGLKDWSYVQRATGSDIILAGNDHPARTKDAGARRHPQWDRVGTTKAVVDFVREFMGVRFLYPDLPTLTPVSGLAKVDLLASPAIEFLPMPRIEVPATLRVDKTPVVRANTAHPPGASLYDLAHNRFPRVDESFAGHTWERAVPAGLYEKHPEYFALINGARLKPEGQNGQYCLSNPDVQELIYRDLVSLFERGYTAADLGQPDGFRPCQCADCSRLFNTGNDWGEKIWLFHRRIAERIEQTHPGRTVTIMSYILTAAPPKSFTQFPANTSIMLTGTNEEDIAPWNSIDVPRGFTGYLYNWCPNLGSRYTPMRTPGFIEPQVRRLADHRIRALYRDGPGQLFGLEGPVYYVMGRMFDDPAHNAARTLLPEFCEAAFGAPSTASAMRSFYDELYHAIALYSDRLGTRCDAWKYQPLQGEGAPRKSITDPFQLLSFLYPPNLLLSLDAHLRQAEATARSPKVRTRLALVRTEFEYLRHLARVVHLHQAFQSLPDTASRDRLLDAIDERNAFINSLFNQRGAALPQPPWAQTLFPFPGHSPAHLRLSQDGYQEPYASTCLNWDTKSLRNSPPPGRKKLSVPRTEATTPLTIDSAQWNQIPGHELTLLPPLHGLPRKTTIRLLYDSTALHLRAESELEPGPPPSFPKWPRDRVLTAQESIDVQLAPQPAREVLYRFLTGANPESKYDAASGFITDVMDPRHGRDDPSWNGSWQSVCRIDAATGRWYALVTIPFQTLSVATPAPGTVWRANFARHHALPREKADHAVWSSRIGVSRPEDRSALGEITFE